MKEIYFSGGGFLSSFSNKSGFSKSILPLKEKSYFDQCDHTKAVKDPNYLLLINELYNYCNKGLNLTPSFYQRPPTSIHLLQFITTPILPISGELLIPLDPLQFKSGQKGRVGRFEIYCSQILISGVMNFLKLCNPCLLFLYLLKYYR